MSTPWALFLFGFALALIAAATQSPSLFIVGLAFMVGVLTVGIIAAIERTFHS